jgi:two-component system OmpR family sensor kinase
LLENALHHGGDVVRITVRTWRGDGESHLEVRDDGPGIAAADIDRIFEPFYRPRDRPRGWDGAGLGLSIAQDLARRNDGRLSVASNPGRGASFRLTVPRLK